MAADTKACIACAESIQMGAKLCKHCGTMQSTTQVSDDTTSKSSRSALTFWATVTGAVVLVITLTALGSNLANTPPNSLAESIATPTPTVKTYSPSLIEAAAGKEFFYVGNGFAAKYDNSGSCDSFSYCSGLKVYSADNCASFLMEVTFANKSNEVIGKASITSPFGLAASERGDYEIGRGANFAFVQLDNIECKTPGFKSN